MSNSRMPSNGCWSSRTISSSSQDNARTKPALASTAHTERLTTTSVSGSRSKALEVHVDAAGGIVAAEAALAFEELDHDRRARINAAPAFHARRTDHGGIAAQEHARAGRVEPETGQVFERA